MTPDLTSSCAPMILHLTRNAERIGGQLGNDVEIGYIYVLRAEGMQRYKIGQTIWLENRLGTYQTHSPIACPMIIAATVPRAALTTIELSLHDRLAEYRRHGEWFDLPDDVAQKLPDLIRDVAASPVRRMARQASQRRTVPEIITFRNSRDEARRFSEISEILKTPVYDLIFNIVVDAHNAGEPTHWRHICERLHHAVERRGLENRVLEMLELQQISFYEPPYVDRGDKIGRVRLSVLQQQFCPATNECSKVMAYDFRDWGRDVEVLVHPPL